MKALTITSFFLNIFFAVMLICAPLFAQLPLSTLMAPAQKATDATAKLELMRLDLNYEVASEMFREELDVYGGEAFDVIYGIPYSYYTLSSLQLEEDAISDPEASLIPLAFTTGYYEPLIADLVAA